MSPQLAAALIGLAGVVIGAVVNGALATKAKVNEEIRKLRLEVYPSLWLLTSHFSRWPEETNTFEDLQRLHREFRTW